MADMWDTRYGADNFVYGKAPNQFFASTLVWLDLSGDILLPAEGEGRNAVYAAQQGLSVYAFDISVAARDKALRLAEENNVEIQYDVGAIMELPLADRVFDAAALIFAHLPPHIRADFHRAVADRIKPGGHLIFEGFSKSNLTHRLENPGIGGPDNPAMLFSTEQIRQDFFDFEIVELLEIDVELSEGDLHNGTGTVIRFIGRKSAIS